MPGHYCLKNEDTRTRNERKTHEDEKYNAGSNCPFGDDDSCSCLLYTSMFRGTPQAFETDGLALELSKRSIKDGKEKELMLIERVFLYMPFMHAESLDAQELGIKSFFGLIEESKAKASPNTAYFQYNLTYAKQHRDIIARFGRFPHRNTILNRPSTPQEAEFLTKPGSSF